MLVTTEGMAKAIARAKRGSWISDDSRRYGLKARFEILMVQWCDEYVAICWSSRDALQANKALELLVHERNGVL